MFNSHNSHVVTRHLADSMAKLSAGQLSLIQFGYELLTFEAAEGRIENRIHDQAIITADRNPEYCHADS